MFSALRIPNRERGQMLVIVALGLTVLIAMAGLIIDGGMALSNRRQVQNAADAAALAGTRVLGLDLKWRADNRPASGAVRRRGPGSLRRDRRRAGLQHECARALPPSTATRGSDDAEYVDFDRNVLGQVGHGVPALRPGRPRCRNRSVRDPHGCHRHRRASTSEPMRLPSQALVSRHSAM